MAKAWSTDPKFKWKSSHEIFLLFFFVLRIGPAGQGACRLAPGGKSRPSRPYARFLSFRTECREGRVEGGVVDASRASVPAAGRHRQLVKIEIEIEVKVSSRRKA